jgi:hypothetical protein
MNIRGRVNYDKNYKQKGEIFMVCTLLMGMVEGKHYNFSVIFLMTGVGRPSV